MNDDGGRMADELTKLNTYFSKADGARDAKDGKQQNACSPRGYHSVGWKSRGKLELNLKNFSHGAKWGLEKGYRIGEKLRWGNWWEGSYPQGWGRRGMLEQLLQMEL